MRFRLVCLMASGRPLTERTSRLLLHTAWQMFHDERRVYAFRTDDAEGEMKTAFEVSNLGSFSGFTFSAEVSTVTGTTKVKFIVEHATLERDIADEEFEFLPWNRQAAQTALWN